MIYHYGVVPASQQVASALAAPLMPSFETLLDDKVSVLSSFVSRSSRVSAGIPTMRMEIRTRRVRPATHGQRALSPAPTLPSIPTRRARMQ